MPDKSQKKNYLYALVVLRRKSHQKKMHFSRFLFYFLQVRSISEFSSVSMSSARGKPFKSFIFKKAIFYFIAKWDRISAIFFRILGKVFPWAHPQNIEFLNINTKNINFYFTDCPKHRLSTTSSTKTSTKKTQLKKLN